MGWGSPIPGAPEGKVRRRCAHDGPFTLVRAFHGIQTWQCLACRKISEVVTRTGKTCLNCGKALTGRQQNWCSDACAREFVAHKSRSQWAAMVKERDNHTCQRCGWRETPESKEAYRQAWMEVWQELKKLPPSKRKYGASIEWEARRRSGHRQLEAHHIMPIEWGGPEFDLDNGVTLCHICHDEVHRELNNMASGSESSVASG